MAMVLKGVDRLAGKETETPRDEIERTQSLVGVKRRMNYGTRQHQCYGQDVYRNRAR